MNEQLIPTGETVLVSKYDVGALKDNGIYLPDTVELGTCKYKIEAFSDALKGNYILDEIKIGDIVLINEVGGTSISYEGKKYRIINIYDILAKCD